MSISRLTIPTLPDVTVRELEEGTHRISFFSWRSISGLLEENRDDDAPKIKGFRVIDEGIEIIWD